MIVSVHPYTLADDASPGEFLRAVRAAGERGLFDLPGLVDYRFLRGIKGTRAGEFTAVWRYESRDAWESLWGPVDDPVPPEAYPDAWKTWEQDLLAPVVAGEPDDVPFTTYQVVAGER